MHTMKCFIYQGYHLQLKLKEGTKLANIILYLALNFAFAALNPGVSLFCNAQRRS